MGSITTFFFDSYAFYEIIHGNKSYNKYKNDIAIITTKLNLMELHYGIMLKHGKEKADKYYDALKKYTIPISDDVIKNANEFRLKLKERKLSYVDCIGYTLARLRNVRFLTGDRQFEDLENTEFVK